MYLNKKDETRSLLQEKYGVFLPRKDVCRNAGTYYNKILKNEKPIIFTKNVPHVNILINNIESSDKIWEWIKTNSL
jgi:hypothetical protein